MFVIFLKIKLTKGCLKVGQRSASCKYRLQCKVCSKYHPTCLHRNEASRVYDTAPALPTTEPNNDEVDLIAVVHTVKKCKLHTGVDDGRRVLSAAVPVPIRMVGGTVFYKRYMALDNWATDSFMSTDLMNTLGAHGSSQNMKLTTMS